jgi:myo-inositol-1(or 4)-monophosphatase
MSQDLLAAALEAGRAAAAILAAGAQAGPTSVSEKSRANFVTEIDLASEAAIRGILSRLTPEVPILGEEGGGPTSGTRWVVDPLDGTTNFVHGFPFFSVSIAFEREGVPEVGVVIDVSRGQTYAAVRGRGATRNGDPIRVSSRSTLSEALCCTGFPYDRATRAPWLLKPLALILERTHGIRRTGSAALDLALVASGALDFYWEHDLARWDVSAGHLLVTEAGGRVSDHRGGDCLAGERPSPLATNGLLHEEALALLAEAYGPDWG